MDRKINIYDKIGSLIPGYSGYADREGRRQCDKILRSQISGDLHYSERLIQDRLTAVIQEKKYDSMNDIEKCRKIIDTLGTKIRYAPYGESSFFSDAQIKENELQEIYKKDLILLEKVQELKEASSVKPVQEILLDIVAIEQLLDARNQYIKEFK